MTIIDARTGMPITVGTGVLHSGDREASYELLEATPINLTQARVTIRQGTGRTHTVVLPIRYFRFGFRSVVIPS